MKRCKHGFMEDECSICTGAYEKNQREVKEHHQNFMRMRIERKRMREFIKDNATREGVHYTEAEIKYIIMRSRGMEKKDFDTIVSMAEKLKRTMGAIEWMMNYSIHPEQMRNILREGEKNVILKKMDKIKKKLGIS